MKRILIVDDSAFVAKLLGRVIESLDCRVVAIAQDGLKGIAAFQEHRPDITLLDVTMPNMDGLECLQQIRKADPNARVIMISAVRTPDTVDRCLAEGAIAFLQKPIRPNNPEDIDRLKSALESTADAASV
ncbi:MAG: response regulator [Planctomycetota bacterium]